ncbi:MAG: rod-binding protein [Spirochaetaceae bacterium]|jgi:flagellar protein FlgJ|nr:rod-binding protein [Spirochaetaceae bacterium]
MSIEKIGSLYQDEARLSPVSRKTAALKDAGGSFAQVLDKIAGDETAPASKKPKIDKTDKLYEQCEALETFLIKNLLDGMRNTVEKSGFIDEGFAGKMYEDMLYDEYAKEYSKNAHFGLAELAYLELTGQRGKSGSALPQ